MFSFKYNLIYNPMNKLKEKNRKVGWETINRVDEELKSLDRILPQVFGSRARENSLKNLYLLCKSNRHVQVKPLGQGYKAKLSIRSKALPDMGFPSQEAIVALDTYGNNMWSFSVLLKEKGKFNFLLEWNNDIHFMSPKKAILFAPSLVIRLKTHGSDFIPLKRELKVDSESGDLITDVLHRETVYKRYIPDTVRRMVRFDVQKKMQLLNINFLLYPQVAGKSYRANLHIPLCVEFHPN